MNPSLGTIAPEARHLNLTWSVADVDRVVAMAARGNTAQQIANAMQRKVADVIALCERNGIFVRMRRRVGR